MTVRKAEFADMALAARIMVTSFRTAFAAFVSPETMAACTNPDNCRAMLEQIFREGKMHFLMGGDQGFLCWQETGAEVEIVAIHSLPESWGSGLGHAMLTEALAQIGERKVFLWAFRENARARRFYEKHGFFWDGTERVSEFDGALEVRYVRDTEKFTSRRFREADAAEVSALVIKTLRISNAKDYSAEYIEKDVAMFTPERVILRSNWTHFYVFCHGERIVGCGAIGPYWGKEDECSLFNIFVLPEYQGRGLGRQIVETLEADEYALRSRRIEIPASITGCGFYRKMGYDFKDGIDTVDAEELFRLEKFRE